MSTVLLTLTRQLALTDLKASIIPEATQRQADEIGFDDGQFKEWKEGVRKGVAGNGWESLTSLLRKHILLAYESCRKGASACTWLATHEHA
jgi:hypothetical protein